MRYIVVFFFLYGAMDFPKRVSSDGRRRTWNMFAQDPDQHHECHDNPGEPCLLPSWRKQCSWNNGVQIKCKKTCGLCGPPAQCHDAPGVPCVLWKRFCSWNNGVQAKCPKTCGLCYPIDPYPECGDRRMLKEDSPSKRIVGGEESIPGSWPWQVAMVMNGTQQCGGSLINRQWVVSAAHCFHDSYTSTNPKHWNVTLGEHRLKEKDSFEQIKQVERIILHPKYKSMFLEGIFDTPPDYDIALVQLDSPVVLDNYVYPICLLRPGVSFHPGQECYVTGWGHTKFNGTQPPALNEAEVKIVSMKVCNRNLSYAGKIHERALCAGFEKGGVDACQFDSGGPLSCRKDDKYFLTGITSWGHYCARPHKYGVYSNMAVMTSWAVKTIKEIKAKGPYVNI